MALMLTCLLAAAAEPVRVVFDTDMGNDIDDALALAVLHAFESRGEAKLLAVTLTKDNRWAAPYVDIVNTFYGRGNIPIGVVKDGKAPKDSDMIRVPCESGLYPHNLLDGRQAPEATELLQNILEREKDNSVVFVQTGFSTNLARLLESERGRQLVARKARMLVVMAGAFTSDKPEYNVKMDIPAAKKLFSEWPTPIVASGFEIGSSILYPARSIEQDFNYTKNHPISHAYRLYRKMPYDRPSWDVTAALFAVRPDRGYFSLSPAGSITVDEKGTTRFSADPNGKHRYMMVDDIQRARALEAMVELASEPPGRP